MTTTNYLTVDINVTGIAPVLSAFASIGIEQEINQHYNKGRKRQCQTKN